MREWYIRGSCILNCDTEWKCHLISACLNQYNFVFVKVYILVTPDLDDVYLFFRDYIGTKTFQLETI